MECDPMSLRLKFVSRLLEGEKMTDLCQEFGISRKTGYKLLERYKADGVSALQTNTSRPHRSPNRTAEGMVKLIVDVRQTHPSWGAPKIHHYLKRKYPDLSVPVSSTIHEILDRNNLVRKKSNRCRFKARGTELRQALQPNDLWCTDFKGQFRLLDKSYCYPLTITDQHSRFLLCVDALESTKEDEAILSFQRVFQEFGLPAAIRSDNGVPFSSRAVCGLSKLSVYWLRLGIRIERIMPGHPEQNGAHERMHLTLKQAVTIPPAKNIIQQQDLFEGFMTTFNHERPHDGIEQKLPSELYRKSERTCPVFLPEPNYSGCDREKLVSVCGSIQLQNQGRVYISAALGGQKVGLRKIEDKLWEVRFMNYVIGYFDEEAMKLTPKEQLQETEEGITATEVVSPMSPE